MPEITPALCEEVVRASLAHLVTLVDRKGKFTYAHKAGDPDEVFPGYNMLRHCGTLWFMSRAITELPVDPDKTILRAMSRLAAHVGSRLEPAPWAAPGKPSLGLVTKGAVKLGGVGLALLALTGTARIDSLGPSLDDALPHPLAETVTQLRQYALDEIDGEDFRHKRDIATGEILPFRSDYYTGEAIFGLLVSGPVTDDLARATNALMGRGYGWAEQSHWMAYAACEAVMRGVVSMDLGRDYLNGLVTVILLNPAYRSRRESTPIACRSEALSRILLLSLDRPGLLDGGLLSRAKAHLTEDLRTQLDWYKDGQFWKGDTADKVQIDYIQHNATGFLQWLTLARRGAFA